MSVKHCCTITRDSISRGEERGLSIVPVRNSQFGDFFFLRFRAVAAQHSGRLNGPNDVPIATVIEQAIKYCPWCGANLSETYGRNFDQLPFIEE